MSSFHGRTAEMWDAPSLLFSPMIYKNINSTLEDFTGFQKRLRIEPKFLCQLAGHLLGIIVMAWILAGVALAADADDQPGIGVRVHIDGDTVAVDVQFFVQVSPEEAWAVMTDFDNASRFIGKLHESRIVSRTADTLVVSQKGSMGLGPFSVPLETVSEILLKPFDKIHSRMISGNMKKSHSETTLVREPQGTRVTYHVESIPDVWIPPVVGRAMIEFETRSRFRQLVDEMIRRKNLPEQGR